MELTAGTRLGNYEILGQLGAGGMGKVFRARDVKLDRLVAIKIIHDRCAQEPAWVARFDREARLLAALSDSAIAAVYGVDAVNAMRYIVMEYVPGQTLAQRLARGPLPVGEALEIARQIAQALEVAHDRGIVHRDLKPGNVMLTPLGKVKVLDFGLASSTETSADPAESSAPDEGQTTAGMVLGTAAYMSPEQARGLPVDRRWDLWAFGCVLYETLTGERAFQGDTVADIFAAVIDRSPDWQLLPAGVPPRAVELLRRCLQKDPQKRQRDAGDARLEIEEACAALGQSAPVVLPGNVPRRIGALGWPILLAGIALSALAMLWWKTAHPVEETERPVAAATPQPIQGSPAWSGQFLLGGATRAYQPRVSPNGNWLAFIVVHEDQAQVGVMRLASGEWWVLTRIGNRGAVNSVCWSKDSNRVFFDRVFDVPVGVYSASPLDRSPDGAREVPVVMQADCPQVIADGSLVVGKLEADGKYRMHRRFPDGTLRPIGPPVEFNLAWTPPIRSLHTKNAVVFSGKVLDGKAAPEQNLYLLDLDTDEYRLLNVPGVASTIVPLAVSTSDEYAYTILPVDDVFQVVRIPLEGNGPPQPLLTLTAFVWGLDVHGDKRLYMDQIQRPLDVLKFAPLGAGGVKDAPVERIAASFLWREKTGVVGQSVELPDGRVVVPSKVAGRSQLLASMPGKDPTPLLEDSKEETSLPAVMVGQNRLAFMAGSGKQRRLRLAAVDDESVRLETTDLRVADQEVSALAASPGGETIYYVQSRDVYEVPADGHRPPRKLAVGDGVAVDPSSGAVVIQQFAMTGVRLSKRASVDGTFEEFSVEPGPWRLAPIAIGGNVIDLQGRILVTAVSKQSWFWRPGILDSAGNVQPIPAEYEGDIYPAGWSHDNQVLGMGYALRGELWSISLADPRVK